MPKFDVDFEWLETHRSRISIYAANEDEALDKAYDILKSQPRSVTFERYENDSFVITVKDERYSFDQE